MMRLMELGFLGMCATMALTLVFEGGVASGKHAQQDPVDDALLGDLKACTASLNETVATLRRLNDEDPQITYSLQHMAGEIDRCNSRLQCCTAFNVTCVERGFTYQSLQQLQAGQP